MRPPKRPPSDDQVSHMVATAFSDAQRTHAAHPRAAKLLLAAYAASPQAFISAFTHALNRVLLVFARQPAVERLVTFVSTFAATHTSTTGDFCSFILAYLLEQAKATSPAVRFRTVQLVAAVLHALPDDADPSDDVLDLVHTTAHSRSLDRVPRVRAAAAAALCRLQTSADPAEDPSAARLVQMLSSDSSAAVRKAALHAVAVSDATLPSVVRRTRDVRPDVRRVAFEILAAKLDPEALHLEERLALLRAGLADRDPSVRNACTNTLLLDGWLDGACEGNVFALVDLLGCNEHEEDVLRGLRAVFASKKHAALIDAIEIDVNNLTHADVLVLRALADTQKGETFMDKYIPSTLAYAEVLRYYAVDDFASRHLLELCKSVDMSDEAGRKGLEKIVRADFLASRQISEETVVGAVRAMRRAMLDEEATTRLLLEIVRHDVLGTAMEEEEESEEHESPLLKSPSDHRCWMEVRGLNICKEVLRFSRQGESTGSVINTLCRSLLELAVLPQIMCVDVAKRHIAMECLGLFCLLDRSSAEARTNMPLFIQASKTDVPEIQELAMQIMVDFLMLFDFNDDQEIKTVSTAMSSDNASDEHPECGTTDNSSQENSLSSLAEECINIFSQNVTHSDGSMRSLAVQGLARLLFVRRISPSPTLLSRMLIAHHNPTTEDDDLLRQCLSVFFPAFAMSLPENRLGFEDSFKQTCGVLISAPSKSPLSTISVVQVAQFVLHLTNPAIVTKKQKQESSENMGRSAGQIHERLAEVVLNEIIDAIENDEIEVSRIYCRILSNFRFSCSVENRDQIEILRKLARAVMGESDDKRVITAVRRFRDRVDNILQQFDAGGGQDMEFSAGKQIDHISGDSERKAVSVEESSESQEFERRPAKKADSVTRSGREVEQDREDAEEMRESVPADASTEVTDATDFTSATDLLSEEASDCDVENRNDSNSSLPPDVTAKREDATGGNQRYPYRSRRRGRTGSR